MPKGFTTLELLVTMTLLALLLAISVPRVGPIRDRLAVTRATNHAAAFVQKGRLEAILSGRRIRLFFGPERFEAHTESQNAVLSDSLLFTFPSPAQWGVSFQASRATITFQPTGLGYGAANTKMIFRRGNASDSLTVSILGRVRMY